MSTMSKRITINRERLKAYFKQQYAQMIPERAEKWDIFTSSADSTQATGYIRPAQWYWNKPVYQGGSKHQLDVEKSIWVVNDEIHLKLDYTINDYQPASCASTITVDCE